MGLISVPCDLRTPDTYVSLAKASRFQMYFIFKHEKVMALLTDSSMVHTCSSCDKWFIKTHQYCPIHNNVLLTDCSLNGFYRWHRVSVNWFDNSQSIYETKVERLIIHNFSYHLFLLLNSLDTYGGRVWWVTFDLVFSNLHFFILPLRRSQDFFASLPKNDE